VASHLFQNVSDDTLTVRNNVNQEALPMRHLGSFLLGTASAAVRALERTDLAVPADRLSDEKPQSQRYARKRHDYT